MKAPDGRGGQPPIDLLVDDAGVDLPLAIDEAFGGERARCSRCSDLSVHVGPIWVFTLIRNPHADRIGAGRTVSPQVIRPGPARRSSSASNAVRLFTAGRQPNS